MVSLSCRNRKVTNQCFDLCGLSCSGEEIKTRLTISDTCTLSFPSRSFSGTFQAALHDTKEHQFCGCHKHRSRLSQQPRGSGAPPAALSTAGARTGPSRAGIDAVLSRPTPLGSPPVPCKPQTCRSRGCWWRGGVGTWGIAPLATGGGAVEAAGWCGVRGARPSQEGGLEQAREGKQAEELPCQFAEMLL